MDFLMQYKWSILLGLEVFAWAATFFMLYARYRMAKFWFKVGAILFAMTGIVPQVMLGLINYVSVGKIDLFTVFILVLLLYGATIGKKHIRKIDHWAKRRFQTANIK